MTDDRELTPASQMRWREQIRSRLDELGRDHKDLAVALGMSSRRLGNQISCRAPITMHEAVAAFEALGLAVRPVSRNGVIAERKEQ